MPPELLIPPWRRLFWASKLANSYKLIHAWKSGMYIVGLQQRSRCCTIWANVRNRNSAFMHTLLFNSQSMRLLWLTGSCIEAAEERNQRRVGTQCAERWAAAYNVLTETSSVRWSPITWSTSRLIRIIHRWTRTASRPQLKTWDARLQRGVCRPSCRL